MAKKSLAEQRRKQYEQTKAELANLSTLFVVKENNKLLVTRVEKQKEQELMVIVRFCQC